MTEDVSEKAMGWEIARKVEAEKETMGKRAKLSGKQIRTLLIYAGLFIGLFIAAVWLARNPFEFTQRLPSEFIKAKGWMGTNNWMVVWWVVGLCAFFEFMDSAGGMGYGTGLAPIMLLAGFDPRQVVPCIMITEMFTFRNFGRASALAVVLLVAVIPVMIYNVRGMRESRS